jgi:light-regulated signal transduction histidine kinase (bacteriophytochrome)
LGQLNAKLEQRVEARTAELQSIVEELEAFSYSIAHDLRAPLRSITSFSQIIQKDAAKRLQPDEKESLERVIRAGQHMAQLIDEILELARITRIELTHNPVDLSDLVYDVVKDVRRTHPERNVEWFVRDGVTAYGDARLLLLLLQNLIDNACKFSRDREVSKIEFGSQREDSEIVYYIRDNGIGFDMRYAKNLFKPFNRLHKVKDYPGTGIGLATVARIAKRHGGKVWAESGPDEGATFYFTLPGAR